MVHSTFRPTRRGWKALEITLLTSMLVASGCRATSEEVQASSAKAAARIPEPMQGAEKIIADIKANGFTVADPSVKWGPTIYVDAEKPSGGFSATPREGAIMLRWSSAAGSTKYQIFRDTGPVIALLPQTTLTLDAGTGSGQWLDSEVAPGTRYYYLVVAADQHGGTIVVATGDAETPALSFRAEHPQPVTETNHFDTEKRQAIRRTDGVNTCDGGKQGADMANGTYGFVWGGLYSDGDFLVYSGDEPDSFEHPFEVHKLRDGSYSLVGYVSSYDVDYMRRGVENGNHFSVYARSWSSADQLVSIPIRRLSQLSGTNIVAPQGNLNYLIDARWK